MVASAEIELEVGVVAARGLAAMDSNGLSDPFAVVSCGGVRSQTRVISKTLTPEWDETFRFQISRATADLTIELYTTGKRLGRRARRRRRRSSPRPFLATGTTKT